MILSDVETPTGRQVVYGLRGFIPEMTVVDLTGPSGPDWHRLGYLIESRWELTDVRMRGPQLQMSFGQPS